MKRMLLIGLCLFTLSFINNLQAKQIKGKLVDSQTGEAIIFANIAIYHYPENKLITGTTSDLGGEFTIKVDEGRYQLKISVIGYEPLSTKEIIVDGTTINLGKLKLSPSLTQLNEVVVTAEKSYLINKPGKQIVNVGKDIASGGGNITNVLRMVPSIELTPRGNMSIRGNQNIKILINGREPAYGIDAATLLKQLPASTVDQIEVITNTSAKDDPESAGGAINIILKKNTNDGLNIGINLEAGKYPFKGSAGFTLNYGKNKTNTHLTYGYYTEKHKFSNKEQNIYTSGNTPYNQLSSSGNGNYKDAGHLIIGGFDYNISDKKSLNFELMHNQYKNKWDYKADNTFNSSHHALKKRSITTNNSKDNIHFTNMILKFESKPEDDRVFSMESSYAFGGVKDKRTIAEINHLNIAEPAEKISSDGDFKLGEIKADYSIPVSDKSSFEMGLNSDAIWFDAVQEKGSLGQFQKKDFKFFQNRHALYGIYTHRFGKLSTSVGIRPEYYYSNTKGSMYKKDISQEYFSFFPNLKMQYDLNKDDISQTINLSFSKRIRRPSDEELDPVIDYSNPTHLNRGNPSLKPEFIYSLELAYSYYQGKTKINSTAFANRNTNVIQQYTELKEDNILFSTYRNHSKSNNLGFEMNLSYKPFKALEIAPSGMFIYSRFANPVDKTTRFNKKGHSWNVSLNNTVTINHKNTFQVQGYYYGENKSAYMLRESYYQVNLGYKRDIMNGIGSLNLSVNDVFNSGGKEKYKYFGDGFTSQTEWHLNSRFYKLSLSFFIK